MSTSRLAGLRYSNAHQSVNRGISPKKVYQSIQDAVQADPFRTQIKTDAKRIEALQFGLDRITRIGERYRENYRVSRADHVRMEREFEYLKSRIQTLASPKLYEDFARVVDPDDPSTFVDRFESFKSQLGQLIDASFEGKYRQSSENIAKVFSTLKQVALGRFEGDINDAIDLEFTGQRGWFQRNTPILRTVMDIVPEISKLSNIAQDSEENWLDSVKELTTDMIINSPTRAIATQVDGIEKTGRIVLDIFTDN